MKSELKKGDCLEGFAHTPMYNPNILPLTKVDNTKQSSKRKFHWRKVERKKTTIMKKRKRKRKFRSAKSGEMNKTIIMKRKRERERRWGQG